MERDRDGESPPLERSHWDGDTQTLQYLERFKTFAYHKGDTTHLYTLVKAWNAGIREEHLTEALRKPDEVIYLESRER